MTEEVGIEITMDANNAVVVFKSASITDVEGIDLATQKIKDFIEEKKPKIMIFDFKGVKFFSSQVLGLLLDIRAKLQPYKGEVVISGINPQLYRVFKITNLDKVFRFFPDIERAIEISNTD